MAKRVKVEWLFQLASDEERPLPVTLDSTYINQLHSELETDGRNIKESGYYDLVAMQLAHGHSVSLIEGGDHYCPVKVDK